MAATDGGARESSVWILRFDNHYFGPQLQFNPKLLRIVPIICLNSMDGIVYLHYVLQHFSEGFFFQTWFVAIYFLCKIHLQYQVSSG